jgi:predicted enzyme related to lactoylglutathione lyase
MNIKRIVPSINSKNLEASKKFYADFIGLKLTMDMDWILTFVSDTNQTAQISIVKSKEVDLDNSNVAITVEVADLDEFYNKAISSDYEVTYPLTIESWGVKRFFLLDPNGVTINMMSHMPNK